MNINGKLITSPGDQGDGLCLWDGEFHTVENCLIDLSGYDLADIDEAASITYGSSAIFRNCLIRGAGKLVLCGSGDKAVADRERGKTVLFDHCILEQFGRRGPEVQAGMQVRMDNCLIRNWGRSDRFTVRSFGAWAHGDGSCITAINCIFMQENGKYGKHWFKNLIGHIGQAWNDRKFAGLFSKDAWRPGNCRGLVASDGGTVVAHNCYAMPDWVVIENLVDEMDSYTATQCMFNLEAMKYRLCTRFGQPYEID